MGSEDKGYRPTLEFDEECGVFTWRGQAAPALDGSQEVMAKLSKAIELLHRACDEGIMGLGLSLYLDIDSFLKDCKP